MTMYNGYTDTIPLKTRLANLIAQIPQSCRARAVSDCWHDDAYEFERYLTSYVILRKWETYSHPADEAQAMEREIDATLDPRTAEQRELDEWQAEVTATRASDYPA
jgi:hypothetical protein